MIEFLKVRRFRSDQSGVIALEFALILPVYLMLFFGVIGFAKNAIAQSQFQSAAFNVRALINALPTGQKQSLTDNDVAAMLSARLMAGGYSWINSENVSVTFLAANLLPETRILRFMYTPVSNVPLLTALIPEPLLQQKIDLFMSVENRD